MVSSCDPMIARANPETYPQAPPESPRTAGLEQSLLLICIELSLCGQGGQGPQSFGRSLQLLDQSESLLEL
jgi:hypothetical protein